MPEMGKSITGDVSSPLVFLSRLRGDAAVRRGTLYC